MTIKDTFLDYLKSRDTKGNDKREVDKTISVLSHKDSHIPDNKKGITQILIWAEKRYNHCPSSRTTKEQFDLEQLLTDLEEYLTQKNRHKPISK